MHTVSLFLFSVLLACGPGIASDTSGSSGSSVSPPTSSTTTTDSMEPTSPTTGTATTSEPCVPLAELDQAAAEALCEAHPLARPECGFPGSVATCVDALKHACGGTSCDLVACSADLAVGPCAERPASCAPVLPCRRAS